MLEGTNNGMDSEEVRELMLQLLESQRAMEKEIKTLKDNLKAQNTLSKEMLKIHKVQKDLVTTNSSKLDRIQRIVEK